jgi:hypothetical protein
MKYDKPIRRLAPEILTRFVPGTMSSLGARDFGGVAATDQLCDDGYALVIAGGDLSRLQNGPLSWNHKAPIGEILSAKKTASEVLITARLAAAGVDEEIDKICDRLKGGVPFALSLQFQVIEKTPIVPGHPERGMRATKWEALETALCLVGMDSNAKVTSRSMSVRSRSSTRAEREARVREIVDNGKERRRAEAVRILERVIRDDKHPGFAGAPYAGLTKEDDVSKSENMREARGHLARALRRHKELSGHHDELAESVDKVREIHRGLTKTLGDLGIEDKGVSRAMKDLDECSRAIRKSHGDAEDAATSAAGCVDRAADCLTAIGEATK